MPSTTNSEYLPFPKARTETFSLTDAPTQLTQLTIGGSSPKPAEYIESDLKVNLQEKTWPQQFGERIAWMAKADVQSAQININPPELGPIQITLNLSGDQAKLSFASPHLEVRQTIENALPQLKEMLSSSGISLGQANVGANLQQQPREPSFQNTNGRQNTDENAILSGSEVALAKGSATLTQRGRGLVDLFA
jgi:flagellar hook-length control protein FliK